MTKPPISLVLTDGRGTGTGSATVEVYHRNRLVATVTVAVEPETGADGKSYPTVKLYTDAEGAKWQ